MMRTECDAEELERDRRKTKDLIVAFNKKQESINVNEVTGKSGEKY